MNRAEPVDRSSMIEKLKAQLTINPRTTAVVTVDMHRGHLDPEVATMPAPKEVARRVLDNAKRFLTMARSYHIPVIHVIVVRRPIEIPSTPFHRAVLAASENLVIDGKNDIGHHNVEGSIQTQLMPEVRGPSDYIINNKKRLSAFYGTDLEILLRTLKADTVVLIGINTNTCVQCTAFEAYNRDFKTVVISDCVGSMYGEDLHVFGLQNVSRCLGWVLTIDEFKEKLGNRNV